VSRSFLRCLVYDPMVGISKLGTSVDGREHGRQSRELLRARGARRQGERARGSRADRGLARRAPGFPYGLLALSGGGLSAGHGGRGPSPPRLLLAPPGCAASKPDFRFPPPAGVSPPPRGLCGHPPPPTPPSPAAFPATG